jgi:hypothetical protein
LTIFTPSNPSRANQELYMRAAFLYNEAGNHHGAFRFNEEAVTE